MSAIDGTSPDGHDTYRELVHREWGDTGIWDYLRYDDEGRLWIGGLRVIDAVRRYGAPLEIVDTTVVERRCKEWMALTRQAAENVRYPGRLDYLYAAKANMASEVTHAAYRSGWGAETSSAQDLRHLMWFREHGLVRPDIRVVCNGFKLPPDCYAWPQPVPAGDVGPAYALPPDDLSRHLRPNSYAERILELARAGWRIVPILDRGETPFFAAHGHPQMSVGLRLRCGPARSLAELDAVASRFGMDRHELAVAAEDIDRAEHLTLTTLHGMVGAAETIPVDVFVESLLLAGRVWAGLRRSHPSLAELNTGGGVPPLGERYEHRQFVERLLAGLVAIAADEAVPPPDVTFELGSLVAAEGGFHVFKVLQRKHAGPPGRPPWAIVDVGLMAAIPDMLILGRPFRFLAVNGANRPAGRVVLGDLTCDGDGRYPPKAFGDDATIALPDGEEEQFVLIQGVGAYQEILSGVRGAHHCGLLEAVELVLEQRADGRVHGRLLPRQTPREAAAVLGYVDQTVEALRQVAVDV